MGRRRVEEREMSTVAAEPKITPEAFLAMPDRERFELIDGHLVEVNVSVLSSLVGTRIASALENHCRPNDLGNVWAADLHVRCFADPGRFRKPDVTFVSRERFAPEMLEEGALTIPPDLVVEVISPNDLAYDVEKKVREYLDTGVRVVWVVYPDLRRIGVHRADGTISGLGEADELSGEDVVPGFRCPVAALFPARPQAPAPARAP
jgi:Uma2 family endonuclease